MQKQQQNLFCFIFQNYLCPYKLQVLAPEQEIWILNLTAKWLVNVNLCNIKLPLGTSHIPVLAPH